MSTSISFALSHSLPSEPTANNQNRGAARLPLLLLINPDRLIARSQLPPYRCKNQDVTHVPLKKSRNLCNQESVQEFFRALNDDPKIYETKTYMEYLPVTVDKNHLITIGERLYSENIELIWESDLHQPAAPPLSTRGKEARDLHPERHKTYYPGDLIDERHKESPPSHFETEQTPAGCLHRKPNELILPFGNVAAALNLPPISYQFKI